MKLHITNLAQNVVVMVCGWNNLLQRHKIFLHFIKDHPNINTQNIYEDFSKCYYSTYIL